VEATWEGLWNEKGREKMPLWGGGCCGKEEGETCPEFNHRLGSWLGENVCLAGEHCGEENGSCKSRETERFRRHCREPFRKRSGGLKVFAFVL